MCRIRVRTVNVQHRAQEILFVPVRLAIMDRRVKTVTHACRIRVKTVDNVCRKAEVAALRHTEEAEEMVPPTASTRDRTETVVRFRIAELFLKPSAPMEVVVRV